MRIVIRHRNNGSRKLSNRRIAIMREFSVWALKKFVSDRLLAGVLVEIVVDFKLTGAYGYSIWKDRPNRPRKFTVEINASPPINFMGMLHTLSHELVHVKQWLLDEYVYRMRGDDLYYYNGEEIDAKTMDYWDYPWEIEAHGRSFGLIMQWLKASGRSGQAWTKSKIVY